jgi:hypothetical protein
MKSNPSLAFDIFFTILKEKPGIILDDARLFVVRPAWAIT